MEVVVETFSGEHKHWTAQVIMDHRIENEWGDPSSWVRIAGDKAKWRINCSKFIQNEMNRNTKLEDSGFYENNDWCGI